MTSRDRGRRLQSVPSRIVHIEAHLNGHRWAEITYCFIAALPVDGGTTFFWLCLEDERLSLPLSRRDLGIWEPWKPRLAIRGPGTEAKWICHEGYHTKCQSQSAFPPVLKAAVSRH